MDAQRQEYDRFGPWAIEITDDDPLPPLFVPYLTRTEPALLRVKVPRPIERQQAHPGMDLYDHLVCLYEEDMVVLQRVGQDVRSETCRYRDVQRLRVDRSLLRGSIRLGLPGRAFDLPYNTVSDTLMLRIVDVVRQRYAGPQDQAPLGTELEVVDGELSFYLEGLLATQHRTGTGMRLLAAQGTVPVASARVSVARRLLFQVANKRLLESIHLTDGRELMIVGRGRHYAYWWQAVYGADTWYVPLTNLRGVGIQDDRGSATITLTLRTDGGESVHVFTHDNQSVEPYHAFLSALPSVSREGRAIATRPSHA